MTWMIWGHPHDLGHLHMIHIHKLGGGRISVDAKTLQRQQQQPAAMEKMRISFNIFYIARWLHILYIFVYNLLWYHNSHSGNQMWQCNIHHVGHAISEGSAFGMKSRKLYSTSFGQRNLGPWKVDESSTSWVKRLVYRSIIMSLVSLDSYYELRNKKKENLSRPLLALSVGG